MDGMDDDDGYFKIVEAERIGEVERYFGVGRTVSVDSLRAFIASRPRKAIDQALYLHCACAHPGVTPALVAFLLTTFPAAAHAPVAPGTGLAPEEFGGLTGGVRMPFPLHLACANPRCPTAVILALLARNPAAAETVCEGRQDYDDFESLSELVRGYDEYFCFKGLPLHYYLSRDSGIEVAVARILVEAYPAALANDADFSPLEILLLNPSVGDFFDTVQLLLERTSAQGGIRRSPLHVACINNHVSLRIVRILVAHSPESINEKGGFGYGAQGLPIHLLCADASASGDRGAGLVDVLEYLIEASPASLQHRAMGHLPIHDAVVSWQDTEFVKALLRHDPAGVSKTTTDIEGAACSLPLHLVAAKSGSGIDLLQLVFDANPEGIWINNAQGYTPHQLARRQGNEQHIAFLDSQMVYARLAKDTSAMTTPNAIGQLPLHRALRDGASLGAIKLLVNGNLAALKHRDSFGDYPLHHACRGRNYAVLKYLLGGRSATASEMNGEGKLPIQLLCQSGIDNQSPEYVETIWRLLLACPEIVSHCAAHCKKGIDEDGHHLLASSRSSKGKGGNAHKKSQFTKHSFAEMLLQLNGTA